MTEFISYEPFHTRQSALLNLMVLVIYTQRPNLDAAILILHTTLSNRRSIFRNICMWQAASIVKVEAFSNLVAKKKGGLKPLPPLKKLQTCLNLWESMLFKAGVSKLWPGYQMWPSESL